MHNVVSLALGETRVIPNPALGWRSAPWTARPLPAGELAVNDEQLVQRARSGDRRAFQALFMAHRGRVARLLARLVPASEVEDVTQEVFLHVHRSLASFRGDARFSTWLYRLALNVARMHVRRAKSRPKLALTGLGAPPLLEPASPDDPREATERTERVNALSRILQRLSEKKREALVLHDFEGLSAEEISRIVAAPIMTVRTRVFYARREVYAALQDEPSLRAALQALGEDHSRRTGAGEAATGPRRAKP